MTGVSLGRIINTPRKFLIWVILFFMFFFIFGFNQSYLCTLINDEKCFEFLMILAVVLAVILSLLIAGIYDRFGKKKKR